MNDKAGSLFGISFNLTRRIQPFSFCKTPLCYMLCIEDSDYMEIKVGCHFSDFA